MIRFNLFLFLLEFNIFFASLYFVFDLGDVAVEWIRFLFTRRSFFAIFGGARFTFKIFQWLAAVRFNIHLVLFVRHLEIFSKSLMNTETVRYRRIKISSNARCKTNVLIFCYCQVNILGLTLNAFAPLRSVENYDFEEFYNLE